MTQEHPITPPPELVRQWMERTEYDEHTWFYESYIAEQAARWGADQELEACIEWIAGQDWTWTSAQLRAARRLKPPSLNEVALQMLGTIERDAYYIPEITDTIRRAIESLPD